MTPGRDDGGSGRGREREKAKAADMAPTEQTANRMYVYSLAGRAAKLGARLRTPLRARVFAGTCEKWVN